MTGKEALKKERARCERLVKLLEEEREKVSGYKQIATIHAAYIAILLKKLGAEGSESGIVITSDDVQEALEKFEARAASAAEGCCLFCMEKDVQYSAEEGVVGKVELE